jgi:hypothetical protein
MALCMLVPVLELITLWSTGVSGDRALAVQVTAPSPWGEFHDIRWILVLNRSWLSVVLAVVGVVVARTVLDAAIIAEAWPTADRPPLASQLRRSLRYTSITLILLSPWAVLLFAVSVVSISWLFLVALPTAVVVALVIHHGSVTGGWWHQVPPLRSIGWVLLTFATESLVGLVMGAAPAAAWIPIALAGGLFNAWAWLGVVNAVTGNVPRRWVPLAPGIVVGMVAIAVVGTTIGFQVFGGSNRSVALPAADLAPTARTASEQPVLIVGGFDSQIQQAAPHPIPGPYDEVRFSYLGLSARGTPRPYPASATHLSIQTLVRRLAVQVTALHRRSGQPIDLVAESEGSLLARTYLAADRTAPVTTALLLSPLDQPARVFYPQEGKQGYGVLTGQALEGLTDLLGGISPVNLPAGSPFLRSIVDHSRELRGLLSCPTAPVHETLVEPLADAVADPVGPSAQVPSLVVAGFHGGLLDQPSVDRKLAQLLAGHPVTSSHTLSSLEHLIRLAAGTWQVPSLPLALYNVSGGSDNPSCATISTDTRRWIDLPPPAGAPRPVANDPRASPARSS